MISPQTVDHTSHRKLRQGPGTLTAVVIRKMRMDDVNDVKRVDAIAWTDLIERAYPDIPRMTRRTDESIVSYMRSDGEGALVAVDEHAGVIGSCFSHTWGRTGWVGPISVLPEYQRIGVGKELLRFSIDYLEDEGCTDIGLGAAPEVAVTVGLYLRMGLRPEGMVVVFGKELKGLKPEPQNAGLSVELYSESDAKQRVLKKVKEVCGKVHPGLDQSKEVELTDEFSFGDTVVVERGSKLAGFSVVHTVARREKMTNAAVRAMCVLPGQGDEVLISLLSAVEEFSAGEDCPELHVAVPSSRRRALDVVLSRGYAVTQTLERMMWTGGSGMLTDDGDNLCSWSG